MKMKIALIGVLSVVCVILFVAVKPAFKQVCVENYVDVNGKAEETGVYLCFSGEGINKNVADHGSLNSDEKSILSLIDLAANPESMVSSGRVDITGIASGNYYPYIKAMHDMWDEVTEKRFLFYADHDDLRKYVLSGVYRGKKIVLQVEVADNGRKLRVNRSKNDFSKILAHWHVYAGQYSDDRLQVPFFKRVMLLLRYNKSCPDENYCLYYKGFSFANEVDEAVGTQVWGDFISQITSGEVEKLAGAMDSKSMENLGIAPPMTELPESVTAWANWFGNLKPVAFVYGDDFLVCFVLENVSNDNIRESYLKGGASPVFFHNDGGGYVAVEINKINVLKELFRRVDFSGESEREFSFK